jgi:hypothetical protein
VTFPARYGVARARAWLRKHGLHAGKVDRTATRLRFRQRDPATCQRGNFATIPMGATGIQQVLCCPKTHR